LLHKEKLAYNTADLLVMPNIPVPGDAEGFGLVALEAASAGLPVVASDLEGIPDAVVQNDTGILVPPGNASAWVSTLTNLLGNQSARHRIRERAPDVVRERFSWDQRSQQILDALGLLVRAHY
jgi:phosphatidylinositol alpha-1,6-mannosyltransferase